MKHYTEIRKTDYDLLWHAWYEVKSVNGSHQTFDRVTEEVALEIARKFGPQPTRKPGKKLNIQ